MICVGISLEVVSEEVSCEETGSDDTASEEVSLDEDSADEVSDEVTLDVSLEVSLETSLEVGKDDISDEMEKSTLEVGFGYSFMLEVMSIETLEDEGVEELFCESLLDTVAKTNNAVDTKTSATTVSTFFTFTLPFLQISICVCIFFYIIP